MKTETEKWMEMLTLLESIHHELQSVNGCIQKKIPETIHIELQQPVSIGQTPYSDHFLPEFVHVAFKGPEIYLLTKAFIDSGGAPNENYKTALEKLVPHLSNKTQRGFSPQSLCKFSDKVNPESKDNVKRFLQRMIRNIDSYD